MPDTPSSDSFPVFENTCLEWLRRLQDDCSPQACALKLEAQALVARLRSWTLSPPDPGSRSHTLADVMELHRRCHEYATRKS